MTTVRLGTVNVQVRGHIRGQGMTGRYAYGGGSTPPLDTTSSLLTAAQEGPAGRPTGRLTAGERCSNVTSYKHDDQNDDCNDYGDDGKCACVQGGLLTNRASTRDCIGHGAPGCCVPTNPVARWGPTSAHVLPGYVNVHSGRAWCHCGGQPAQSRRIRGSAPNVERPTDLHVCTNPDTPGPCPVTLAVWGSGVRVPSAPPLKGIALQGFSA